MAPPTLVTGFLLTLATNGAMLEALSIAQCATATSANALLRLLPPLLLPSPATILVQATLPSIVVPVALLRCMTSLPPTLSQVTL